MLQKRYSKMHLVSCTNTHHDITDLVNYEIVKNENLNILQNIIFLQNKKILNLCLRCCILRSYHFVAALTFKCHIQPKDGKNQLDFQIRNFMLKFFEKKSIKIKYCRSLLGAENSWWDHQQPSIFFSVFADFRTLADNSEKPKLVDSKQKN